MAESGIGRPSASLPRQRIVIIDALRGLSVVLMVGYHTGIQLIDFMGAPESLVFNPLLNTLQPIFGGLFILLSGVSSRFSRSNSKRGLKTLACAALVTVVMYRVGYPVWFGILHFLGFSMLLYGVGSRFFDRVPRPPLLYGALFMVLYLIFPMAITGPSWLLPLGLYVSYGNDYFPLLPWLPLFLLGTWLGGPIRDNKLPRWFYRFCIPLLPWVGRHALIIYLAHQPVILAVLLALGASFA